MQIPKNHQGRINKFAYAIHKFWGRSFWVRWILAPSITGILPSITLAYFSNRAFGNTVKQWSPAFSGWFDGHAWVILLLVFIYPTLLLAFARFVVHRVNANEISPDTLLSLIAILDRIVGCKAKRFGDFVKQLAGTNASTTQEVAFEAITQPKTQIVEITRGVCELFNVLQTDAKPKTLIKVVLVEIKNKKIIGSPLFFPEDEPVRTQIKVLNNPESTVMTALKTKKIVIIESTHKEAQKSHGRRYVPGDNDDGETDGSLICYPIRHDSTNSIPYVLSIHSDVPGFFTKQSSELYKHLLGRFEHRISLEYSLVKIKEGGV